MYHKQTRELSTQLNTTTSYSLNSNKQRQPKLHIAISPLRPSQTSTSTITSTVAIATRTNIVLKEGRIILNNFGTHSINSILKGAQKSTMNKIVQNVIAREHKEEFDVGGSSNLGELMTNGMSDSES